MMAVSTSLVGKWRIVEAGVWSRDHLDLCGPAFLRIGPDGADGAGGMAFGALTTAVDAGFTATGVNFEWNGADEGDQVTGSGWLTYATMDGSKAKSPTTMATKLPSSPNRGVLQQPVKAEHTVASIDRVG